MVFRGKKTPVKNQQGVTPVKKENNLDEKPKTIGSKTPKGKQSLNGTKRVSFQVDENEMSVTPGNKNASFATKRQATPAGKGAAATPGKKDNSMNGKKPATPANKGKQEFNGMKKEKPAKKVNDESDEDDDDCMDLNLDDMDSMEDDSLDDENMEEEDDKDVDEDEDEDDEDEDDDKDVDEDEDEDDDDDDEEEEQKPKKGGTISKLNIAQMAAESKSPHSPKKAEKKNDDVDDMEDDEDIDEDIDEDDEDIDEDIDEDEKDEDMDEDIDEDDEEQTPPKGKKLKKNIQVKQATAESKSAQSPKKEKKDVPQMEESLKKEEFERRGERDAKSLFIGNLPKDCQKDELKFLSPDVVSITMSRPGFKAKTRCAFFEFESEEKAEENYKLLQQQKFRGQKFRLDFCGAKSQNKKQEEDRVKFELKKLVVYGVPMDSTIAQVAKFFPKATDINFSRSQVKKEAHIEFSTVEDANEAFKLNPTIEIGSQKRQVMHMALKSKNRGKGGRKRYNNQQQNKGAPSAKRMKMTKKKN